MRKLIIRAALAFLNSRIINRTPCQYAFVGNVDAFSYEHLKSEESQRPGITVKQILQEADTFRACLIGKGLTVIDGEEIREANAFDMRDLRESFKPRGE